MATTMPTRGQPFPPINDRRSSLSSAQGSRRSSNSFSRPIRHSKAPSQHSASIRSPIGSVRSQAQPQQQAQTHRENGVRPRRSQRLKSQYPVEDSEPHVEYILVASFDIDRGPTMEHQYPGVISPDENLLAELMLPDQTHMRTQDWTIFFLHKNSGEDEEVQATKEESKKQRQEEREQRRLDGEEVGESDDEDSDEDDPEGPSLMYVLNLVYTKHDPNEKRGAKTQAMAICTRHSFLHIYKPLLLLALESYFNNSSQHVLEVLYNSLNAMDLSLMPRLSRLERQVLQANDVRDLFVEKFETMIEQRLDDEAGGLLASPPASPDRANQNKSAPPRDTHEFESRIVYNDIPIPVKIPTAPSAETVGDFSLIQLVQTFNTPHAAQPQPFALHPHLTTAGAYTHPIIVLINAMLTQKRIIFLGHQRPSGEVAEAVLAACALASGGILSGFTKYAFPYTDLSKIDELLNVPGYIAGVTNPAFSYHPEWWDLLIDLPAGRMKISSSIAPAPITEGSTFFSQQPNIPKETSADPTGDVAFMDDIMASIEQRQGEQLIRSKFRSYISKFTRMAASFEETVYGASSLTVLPPTEVEKPNNANALLNGTSRKSSTTTTSTSSGKPLRGHGYVWPTEEAKTRELAATTAKIEGWRSTRSYYAFIQDLAAQSQAQLKEPSPPISPISPASTHANGDVPTQPRPYLDICHTLSRLRTLRLTSAEAAPIYLALANYCTSYTTILELLSHAPLSEAGLFHVSLGLWHDSNEVRTATTTLLERVRQHPAGRIWFSRLGGFASQGFRRSTMEAEARRQRVSEED